MPLTDDAHKQIGALFERYGPGVGRYVRLRVGSPELAEEITARVFLTVVRSYEQMRGSPVGWLWSIVRTELARLGRERTHRPYPLDLPAADGRDELERQEFASLLHAALERLPDEQQQLISLKFFLGLSNQEIAQATGLTANHVGVKLHRVLKELREMLSSLSASEP